MLRYDLVLIILIFGFDIYNMLFYLGCNNTSETPLLTDRIRGRTLLTETSYLKHTSINFRAENLLYTLPFAWCIQKTIPALNSYDDYATVNLDGKYLLHGLAVSGYADVVNKPSVKYLAKMFKFQYSLDGKVWAYYHAAMVRVTVFFYLDLSLDCVMRI